MRLLAGPPSANAKKEGEPAANEGPSTVLYSGVDDQSRLQASLALETG